MNDEGPMISPEWLEQHGFVLLTEENWGEVDGSHDFTETVGRESRVYIQKELDRNQFVVVLEPGGTGQPTDWAFEIFVKWNIGCGYMTIPSKFSEMTIHHFCLLYEGIRREKLC